MVERPFGRHGIRLPVAGYWSYDGLVHAPWGAIIRFRRPRSGAYRDLMCGFAVGSTERERYIPIDRPAQAVPLEREVQPFSVCMSFSPYQSIKSGIN